MDFLKQLGMLLRMNLLGVPQRLGLACTIVIGVTCAVGVLVTMLAMGVGARRAAMGNVRPDRASVLNLDAVEPDRSDIPKDLAAVIADLPGIRRDSRRQPIAVPEVCGVRASQAEGLWQLGGISDDWRGCRSHWLRTRAAPDRRPPVSTRLA
jgi:hypothetical protein